MVENEVKCLPQVVEIENIIPANCGQSYNFEQPLLLATWKQDSIVTTITNVSSSCSGGITTTPNPNGSVNMQLVGTSSGCSNVWLFDLTYSTSCVFSGGGTGVIGVRTYEVTGGKPIDVNKNASFPVPSTGCNGTLVVNVEGGGTINAIATICPPAGCSNFIEYPPNFEFGNVRIKPGTGVPCEQKVTIRWEGCSEKPPGTYGAGNPAPGGGSSGGSGSPGGNPPPSGQSPNPPPSAPSSGFGGGGGGAGGGGGGSNPTPLGVLSPPITSINTSQPSGSQIIYPNQTVLTPQPSPQFPTLIVILPGSEPEELPWNGYAVYPGNAAPGSVVVGATYPALYVSPMMAQRVFSNWKSLKHILLQFENKQGNDIQTALTTTDAAQYGKALQRFNALVGIIYNDEFSDAVTQELYRYDNTLWNSLLFTKHYSPKQVDDVVSFKEALLGTSYSYQVAVFSSDAATWKLVGWQVEGKPKGKRRSHGRD